MQTAYDAIVVGTRCAGAPIAMLLARMGHRVLALDRARFPSDTISTHLIHPPGVAHLKRWGLLDRVVESGCPPVRGYSYDLGSFTLCGSPQPYDGVSLAYAPRRTILDKLLVEAAAEAGAEVREGCTAERLDIDDGRVSGLRFRTSEGKGIRVRARVVIGADGRHSLVAKAVRPPQYNARPPLTISYYAYWSGLPTDRFETAIVPERGIGVIPTNDGLTVIAVGWPYEQLKENRGNIEGNYLDALMLVPTLAERILSAKRETRFVGTAVKSYFRKPYGPGWALVGDAAYNKDPISAWGISDAFRDAELCASRLDHGLSGSWAFEDAMADYQRVRDELSAPIYDHTCSTATLEPPPPKTRRLLAAIAESREESDAFASVMAGTSSAVEFFAPAHIEQILLAAAADRPAVVDRQGRTSHA